MFKLVSIPQKRPVIMVYGSFKGTFTEPKSYRGVASYS